MWWSSGLEKADLSFRMLKRSVKCQLKNWLAFLIMCCVQSSMFAFNFLHSFHINYIILFILYPENFILLF